MTVLFYGDAIKHAKGAESFAALGSTSVRGLIDELGAHFGQAFKDFLLGDETCLILVNGKGLMPTGGIDTPLSPGDRIEILPFVEAG